ncbi:Nrm1p [Saccharomyces cerevisiae x Saccharomyces kudriavzevii VIN7]|uniref:Nrm1p n=1 Tax=Saccharomyces cerevisiae x Saccharomyces kudriavzevii (strain VIN7) TaxID=1095631 RepID=H0H0H0_SACCK|nr:Nrm1p [Saccharomyces cerevisiae x Saccharomyces kudriavzevii VIN7]
MSIMKQRLPLGEFSSSKINKLAIANIADATEPRSRGENSVGAVCLPSIKSLMVSPEVYDGTKSLPVPLMGGGGGSGMSHGKQSSQNEVHPEAISRDYSELSKKLQIRLQFAYYKYKTKQTNKHFTDLKLKHSITKPCKKATHTKSEPLTKRRKLVLSQGHYKTPAKSKIKTPPSIYGSHANASSFSCSHGGSESLGSAADTNITDTTTPIRNIISTKHFYSHNRTMYQRQETPTSIKAAKSLIHLFTSNQ